jgi:hypothetical protein
MLVAETHQFGNQAGLADVGLAPQQDDGRLAICGSPPGRLKGLEYLDPADKGRARCAAAHLAGIIARDRPEGKACNTGSAPKI